MSIKDRQWDNTGSDDDHDRELFARHLRGEHDALLALFDRYHERLWLYVARMCGRDGQADDILQEFWERIIRLREKEAVVPDKVRGYLFRTARNIFLNSRRSKRETVPVDELNSAEHPMASFEEEGRDVELLRIALAELPELQREILILHAWSGFRYEEIAEMYDKTPGAIHTMAWRARKDVLSIMKRLMKLDDGE